MKTLIISIIFIVCAISLSAQDHPSGFPILSGHYLGQKPPGMTPELFAPGIVSTGNHEHSRIEFSKDGNEMYWAVIPVVEGKFQLENQKIWYTQKGNTGWSKPKPLSFDLERSNDPTIDNRTQNFYFKSAVMEDPLYLKSTVWVKSVKDTSWENVKQSHNVLPQIEGKGTMSFCFASNGNLYFDLGGPDETGDWSWNIYIKEFNDSKYQEQKLLEGGINDGKINYSPWISPDESYLIWASGREGNFGHGDLYISFRNKNGSWSNTINMGDKINTEHQERFPSVSPDGKYLFFARHPDSITYSDFYWVSAKIIEDLKPKECK